jgi:hypothetical protein
VAEGGSLIVASTPQEFGAFLSAEQKRMRDLVSPHRRQARLTVSMRT